jgi:hypothetical protein
LKEEKKMKRKLTLVGLSFLVFGLAALLGCAGTRQVLGEPVVSPGGQPPMITAYFAPTQGNFGSPLRIYLAAEDPTGEMLRIAVQVSQEGYGYYPTDWTFLKPQYQKSFVGYLQWNTAISHTGYMPEWTQLTIKVSVFDKEGRSSNEIVLPYEFVSGAVATPPLPAPFDKGNLPRLGYIDIRLFNPFDMGRGRLFED